MGTLGYGISNVDLATQWYFRLAPSDHVHTITGQRAGQWGGVPIKKRITRPPKLGQLLILGTFLELGLPARLWLRWTMMPLKEGRHHHLIVGTNRAPVSRLHTMPTLQDTSTRRVPTRDRV